ncbi:MAG: glycosyltransferase family 1 protein [bacterium]
MNIGLDMSPIADGKWTGVGNYIINLVSNLAKIDKENKYFLCYRLSRLKNKMDVFKNNPPLSPFEKGGLKGDFKIKIIQEPFNFIFQTKLDIFHGLADRLPWSYKCKNIVTIHDIGSVILEDNFASKHFKNMMRKRYENILNKRKADLIIAPSEFTKKEIVKYFSYPEEKIRVIYHGVKPIFSPRDGNTINGTKQKYGIKNDYFLYVGAVNLRKNILRMLRAYKMFSDKNKKVDFVLIGNLSYGHEEILDEMLKLNLKERIKLIGYLKNNELVSLYSGAKALVFPSLYMKVLVCLL